MRNTCCSVALVVCLIGSAIPVSAQERNASLSAYLQSRAMHDVIEREAARMSGAVQTSPPAHASRRWVSRHPFLTGMLIGLGTGIGLDAACRECGPAFSTVGVLAGAWGGAIAKALPKPQIAPSSTPPNVADVKRVVTTLGPGERVRVNVGSGSKDGVIQTIGVDRFVLVPDAPAPPVEVAFSDVIAIRKLVGTGTKIGVATGAGIVGLMLLNLAACAAGECD